MPQDYENTWFMCFSCGEVFPLDGLDFLDLEELECPSCESHSCEEIDYDDNESYNDDFDYSY